MRRTAKAVSSLDRTLAAKIFDESMGSLGLMRSRYLTTRLLNRSSRESFFPYARACSVQQGLLTKAQTYMKLHTTVESFTIDSGHRYFSTKKHRCDK